MALGPTLMSTKTFSEIKDRLPANEFIYGMLISLVKFGLSTITTLNP